MQGKIVKGIAGFYYVHIAGFGIYECKAKGIFRKEGKKPLVGDNVEIDILSEEDKEGNIKELLPRKNELARPAVCNVDQALVVFAVRKPKPHLNLLDRFLIEMERKGVPAILCFNKLDIATEEEMEALKEIYRPSGYKMVFISARLEERIDEIKMLLKGKTTTVAGPSGVGKSSMVNCLQKKVEMETGDISSKIDRGKHTTRHSELIAIDQDTYIMDTPGFSSLYTNDLEKDGLKYCFPEFSPYESQCRFHGCNHVHEPDCAVKQALLDGKIHQARYQSYLELYKELKEKRRF